MKIIGAGVGRTGTTSLKIALEQLTGKPCFHMVELFNEPNEIDFWQKAVKSTEIDWLSYFSRFDAAVDWPSAAFWPELIQIYPDALVLLSQRPAEAWWQSANNTIFPAILKSKGSWRAMMDTLLATRFTSKIDDKNAAIEAYLHHNTQVIRNVSLDRLIVWQPGDCWTPLCNALGLPVPDTPFPHVNTAKQYQKRHEI